ncbi:MAG: HAD-IIIA family hydrolase [Syntrophales bacterium]|jgi:3-deoxy-D-manno-octulosonate 8-phosphate phosphatase (KDO 8-P phosphatase)|nr:HAD-IIIA family hydrolase [Syntrophales bacterium]HOG07898.1 HAD-IIIA family hydrolase [Syntrophales bacterium]HOS76683.1 HAD-IIIA family hydrolase [Syntrophales bacterium]HPB70682.1 HAD-IIIA family hydrolase [Syntrophales bacterium]HQN26758.1 HAD-IIIA family hydrolase [Syntrophales bacterium]
MTDADREKVLALAAKIRLLILDVDGVLTDGRIIMDDEGRESKHFDVKDGHGLKMLMRGGVDVVIITGRLSRVVEHRARDLGIQEVHQQSFDKLAVFEELLPRRGVSAAEVAYVGDDIVDIPLLKRVGLAVGVADAAEEVLRTVDYVTLKPGGRGAVREVCELILQARGLWPGIGESYAFA